MGGVLTVSNDRLHDFEILQASIFTVGQGICLQRLEPVKSSTFKFDHSLAYGSWYDIQIIGRSLNGDTTRKIYLKKGIYLRHGKIIQMTELIGENHLDHGVEWICSSCKKVNVGSVAICEHCYTNKSQAIVTAFSNIPLIGTPFALADAILQCGKASQSDKMADKIDAGMTTAFALLDFFFSLFIFGSLIRTTTKVAAGTTFDEVGRILMKQIGQELGTNGMLTKYIAAKTLLKKIHND